MGLMRSYRKRAVIVAMISVRMMQPAVDEIINVVTMWNGLMTTVRAIDVLICDRPRGVRVSIDRDSFRTLQ
jgi:hypothetical protein